MSELYDVSVFTFDVPGKLNGYRKVDVKAGRHWTERIVPPAGEEFAFNVERWDHDVAVYVSPTGRSVRVWLDGVETPFPKKVADE